jgi:predicted glycosyltransferase
MLHILTPARNLRTAFPSWRFEGWQTPAVQSTLLGIDEAKPKEHIKANARKKIWIDLDNSPHVPFFIPIIEGLKKKGHQVVLTARDSYQVCQLAQLHHLSCTVVGRHWGRNPILKVIGTLLRAGRLMPLALKEKPDLAVSHVSRSQFLACAALGIPTVVMFDYEFISKLHLLHPDWIFVPELVSDSAAGIAKKRVFHYPGLKEDVYAPRFKPDLRLRGQLTTSEAELLVTVRPPADEAHYHNPESDKLLDATLDWLSCHARVRVVLVPRNDRQARALAKKWAQCISDNRFMILDHVLDGLNLIWCSDLVVSGGGTMNREAAALGVPVYSIFRGKVGAVDRYLAKQRRLIMIENSEDIRTKIVLMRRHLGNDHENGSNPTLDAILGAIISIAESQSSKDPNQSRSDGSYC